MDDNQKIIDAVALLDSVEKQIEDLQRAMISHRLPEWLMSSTRTRIFGETINKAHIKLREHLNENE